jgi:tetratricopeptide (TPR) repeat protein
LILFESCALDWSAEKLFRRDVVAAAGLAAAVAVFVLLCPPVREDPGYVRYLRDLKHGQEDELHGRYQDARTAYRRALAFAPRDPGTLFSMGNACLLDGEYREAQRWYRRALNGNGMHMDALYNLGYALERTGDLREAERCYRKVLVYQPGSRDARARLERVLEKELKERKTEGAE